jgi:cytidyltransferase-like protein
MVNASLLHNIITQYYNSPGRHWHNAKHPAWMLDRLNQMYCQTLTKDEYEILCYAIVYHDAVYDPTRNDNEERSCNEFTKNHPNHPLSGNITDCIMATKNHNPTTNKLQSIMIELDTWVLHCSINELIDYEHQIFLEYQFTDIDTYIDKRCEFLTKMNDRPEINNDAIGDLIPYIKNRHYRIGIYPGSFNPFHVGHLNILRKAEKVFDKVILARGMNPDKPPASSAWDISLPNQKIVYDGLVIDLFKPSKYNVEYFMIRGMRSVYDVGYEEAFRKTILDMSEYKGFRIQFLYFFCDRQYDHVSSSTIRGIQKFDYSQAERYLVK